MMHGPAIAILFAVVVIVIAGMFADGRGDCPRGSVTASGIARCR